MPDHQLPLLERGELRLDRGAQHRVAWRREFVAIHPAVERAARVADDAPMNLRPELLRAEEHEAEVAAALSDVEQHLANVGVLAI